MASIKDASPGLRSLPQPGLPIRQTNLRGHSHSVSLGAVNANNRVTRRKSMTSTVAANAAAAIAATLKGHGESTATAAAMPVASHRRTFSGRKGLEPSSGGTAFGFGSYLSRSVNGTGPDLTASRKHSPTSIDENTVVDGSTPVGKPVSTKDRNRRASEGSYLVRGEGKRVSSELRCDQCGKGYKHSSCLTKHMWEHDPAWAYTSKLLISKHQQVQLLEAATVLVNLNQDPPETADAREVESDNSSASPTASSELRDGLSSADTTPPPLSEEAVELEKRLSINSSSVFSRSFQSFPSSSFTGSAPLYSPAFSHFRQSSVDTRPSTAETGPADGEDEDDDEEADLAAAIGLCSFGTPRSKPMTMASDIPPVPPLPARFLDQSGSDNLEGGPDPPRTLAPTAAIYNSHSLDPSLSYKVSDERDVKMADADRGLRHHRNSDVDFDSHPAHADDDDGVFGRMEE